jgi:hypothetical protein
MFFVFPQLRTAWSGLVSLPKKLSDIRSGWCTEDNTRRINCMNLPYLSLSLSLSLSHPNPLSLEVMIEYNGHVILYFQSFHRILWRNTDKPG